MPAEDDRRPVTAAGEETTSAPREDPVSLRRPPRVRWRAFAVGALVTAVVVSGLALDRGFGQNRAATIGSTVPSSTGAWFCPHGGGPGWKGWVVMTNPGPAPVRVRLTSFGSDGSSEVTSLSIEPEHEVYRAIAVDQPAAATQVEYFGGWIAAGTVIRSQPSSPAMAAAGCRAGPTRRSFVPDVATGPGESSYLVVMNPFGGDAQFEVTMRTERRVVKPPELTPRVLPQASSVAIPLHEFILTAGKERTSSVEVTTTIGRVIAGAVNVSEAGVSAEPAVGRAAASWILPAPLFAPATELSVTNPGERLADIAIGAQRFSGGEAPSTVRNSTLKPHGVRTYAAPPGEGVGTLLRSSTPVAAAMRTTGPKGDAAVMWGSSRPASRWVVLPTMPPARGTSVLLLQNPGAEAAHVTVRLVGPDGPLPPQESASFEVRRGRIAAWRYPETDGEVPLTAVVTSETETIVAASASISLDGRGYGMALGVPMFE